MTTIRKQIRHAIADVLRGNTLAGENVFASRTRKISEKLLPAILVYTREESFEVFNASPLEWKRTLTVGIEIVARADEDLDDQLDDIAGEVERIMSENQTLDCLASDVAPSRIEIQLTADGDNQHGACILTYDIVYYTFDVSEGEEGPGVPTRNVLHPFQTANVDYKVPPSQDVSATDNIPMPQ